MKIAESNKKKGFTLIELMVVIAIIGIITAIAIPAFLTYKKKGYNAAANSDARNAYTAAQEYFDHYATAQLNIDKLKDMGFQSSAHVQLVFTPSMLQDQDNLEMSIYHLQGSKTYTVTSNGITADISSGP